MKLLDRACAGALFLLAVVECWLVPRDYTGRIWIFGTGLALLFTAMLNLLRLRNGYGVQGLRLFCIGANVIMTVFVMALILSIGWPRTLANPQVLLLLVLLGSETPFSLAKNP
ncbi:MAG TPA: hypothetical protein VEI01_10440 [Terriglobales bacterium]|nr:hypothetical protein [Terriglobales bacterium]